jgi:hypothetical protein
MSTGFRHFLYEADGTLRSMPLRVFDGLVTGRDRLPQYANQSLRILGVFLNLEDGRPVDVKRVEASIWHFDQTGELLRDLRGAMMALEDSGRLVEGDDWGGPVVDITAQLEHRNWNARNRWEPTPADITRVVHIIWPAQAGREVSRPAMISGAAERRVPMTYAAKHALRECHLPLWEVGRKLEDLGDKDLKAFIQGAREKIEPGNPVSNEFWKGLAGAAEQMLEIRKIKRSGKGIWYAAIEKCVMEPPPSHTASITTVVCRECKGRGSAVKAARELLAEYAHLTDADTEISARLYPAIEWNGPSE